MQVHLSRPDITDAEIKAVVEVLRSPNLSLGPKLGEFEQAFCDYIGVRRAVAVNSGTSGLYLVLKALNIGPGDEVITTPFTFIASTTCIMMTGARPVFVDIDPVSLNLDPALIEPAITENTKAILPVEVFGSMAHLDRIRKIARRHHLPIVEDCCEALGSQLHGEMAGTFGRAGVFAFYPNKQITTGEGGMIVTDDEDLADMCVSLRNQGRGKGGGWLGHDRLGYNYRLSDINCALGIVQLSRIEQFKVSRGLVADCYRAKLASEPRVHAPTAPKGCDMSWFVFVVRLADNYTRAQRDAVLAALRDRGIQASNYFPPVHLQPFMTETLGTRPGDFPLTEAVSDKTIALPFHNNLPESDIDLVCRTLTQILDEIG